MAIELKFVREDDIHGIVAGSVYVDGVFVCHEYGNTTEELWGNFENSKELYKIILKDDFEKDCI